MIDPKDVVAVRVHPAIGVARVGNATEADDYFFAAEVPGAAPEPVGGFRDHLERLKRQAARFRIYATLASGEIREVTADEGEIHWRVEVANLKAGWYRFTTAMDLPRNLAVTAERRNPMVGRDDVNFGHLVRSELDIVPSRRTISGRNVSGPDCEFSDGKFFGTSVYLGELRTDGEGRLVVLGGRGHSAPQSPDVVATTFANNDGWHDDVSDGPVRATVVIGGKPFDAEPGYVVVAPPNYGPGLFGVLTMDDVVREAFYVRGFLTPPTRPDFTADIWPIFDRLTGAQWVNQGIFMLHGHGSPLDARDPAVVARLANPDPSEAGFRQAVAGLFRDPAAQEDRPAALPPYYGDGVDYQAGGSLPVPVDGSSGLSLTPTLYRLLGQWARGDFTANWAGFPTVPAFGSLTPAQQCEALDRAGLYELLGGPFHPGIELTWIMRVPQLWRAAYRLNLVPEGTRVRQDYGPELTPEICLGPHGPLAAAGPGALTRWLGVPWQTDEASCGGGGDYTPAFYLSVPSFWGPRVPNEVMPLGAFERLQARDLPAAQRSKHLGMRRSWYRLIKRRPGQSRPQAMVTQWWRLGVIEPRDLAHPGDLPTRVHVEVPTSEDGLAKDPTFALAGAVDKLRPGRPPSGPKLALAPSAQAPVSERTFEAPRIRYHRGEV